MFCLSSSLRSHGCSSLLHGGLSGSDSIRCTASNISIGAKGYGFLVSRFGCKFSSTEMNFPLPIISECSNVGRNWGKLNFTIRSQSQPSCRGVSGENTVEAAQEGVDLSTREVVGVYEPDHCLDSTNDSGGSDFFNGSDGNGNFSHGGGGGGDGGGSEDNKEEGAFGPLLKYDEVIKEAESRGLLLPSDMLEAAKTDGIEKVILDRYLDLQESAWPLGFLMKFCVLFRNRMLADPSFIFKVGTEIVIDSCCATFAEVKTRGKDFWAEFELYAADLLVGVTVSAILVGLLAPYARIGKSSVPKGLLGQVALACGALPSHVFEAGRPGCNFSIPQRVGTFFYKGFLYGSVGFGCGLVGQGIANFIMTAKRSVKKSEEDVPVPPLLQSAALWGAFLAVSSNARYQIINGMEGLVEASPLARHIPYVAMAFTIGVRFANNVYGGMQFVDWARWSGVQ